MNNNINSEEPHFVGSQRTNKKILDELFPLWKMVSNLGDRRVFDSIVYDLIVCATTELLNGKTEVTTATGCVLVRGHKEPTGNYFEVCITIHFELR